MKTQFLALLLAFTLPAISYSAGSVTDSTFTTGMPIDTKPSDMEDGASSTKLQDVDDLQGLWPPGTGFECDAHMVINIPSIGFTGKAYDHYKNPSRYPFVYNDQTLYAQLEPFDNGGTADFACLTNMSTWKDDSGIQHIRNKHYNCKDGKYYTVGNDGSDTFNAYNQGDSDRDNYIHFNILDAPVGYMRQIAGVDFGTCSYKDQYDGQYSDVFDRSCQSLPSIGNGIRWMEFIINDDGFRADCGQDDWDEYTP